MSDPGAATLLHASCVAIGGHAVLIVGASGAGKSDLALRLIDRGAILIADDCTLVRREGQRLTARAPDTIAGRIEVRGLGIVPARHADDVAVALVVALGGPVERLPEPDAVREIAGVAVAAIALAGFEASAPIKVGLALARATAEDMP